jgi:hypothetical protein
VAGFYYAPPYAIAKQIFSMRPSFTPWKCLTDRAFGKVPCTWISIVASELFSLSHDALESILEPLDGIVVGDFMLLADLGLAPSSSCNTCAWSSP